MARKFGQSLIIWLVPVAGALVVRHLLHEPLSEPPPPLKNDLWSADSNPYSNGDDSGGGGGRH